MDEALVATTNRVFEVTDETSYLEKQDIRGAMMIRYFAHLPEITACNLRAEQAEQSWNLVKRVEYLPTHYP